MFAFDASNGKLSILQTVSALPQSFNGKSAAAQILVHEQAGVLYASNRGHDSIVIFAIGPDGRLRLRDHVSSGGERPHNFTLDPTGGIMLVANQRSDRLSSFTVDAHSGALTPTEHSLEIPSPVCVVIR